MMMQFERIYWPGGMSLRDSGWWLVLVTENGYFPLRELEKWRAA